MLAVKLRVPRLDFWLTSMLRNYCVINDFNDDCLVIKKVDEQPIVSLDILAEKGLCYLERF